MLWLIPERVRASMLNEAKASSSLARSKLDGVLASRSEIRKGIQPGERVVVAATFLVDSESRLKTPASMPTPARPTDKPAGMPQHMAAAKKVKDPSCGMPVDPAKLRQNPAILSPHRGATYYFCSAKCKETFQNKSADTTSKQASGRLTMINRIIDFSVQHKLAVLASIAVACIAGWWAMVTLPLDATPDLSDTQVIIYSHWDRSPDIVEDQVTYPIVTAMLGAPQVKTVRGFSDFGYSYVYVIFEDGTDLYWARSRIVEYLSSVPPRLPEGVKTELGPDATALGWVFQYALVDTSGKHSLADLRSYQDWYLRYYLRSVPGVAEVAPIGGYTRQYQVNLDPNRLRAYGIPVSRVVEAVRRRQQRIQRSIAGVWRHRVHGSWPRLRALARGFREHSAERQRTWFANPHQRRRPGGDGARPAARRCRSGWHGRSSLRHRRHAQRRKRAGRHQPGESEDQGDRAGVPGGREAGSGLRPLGADPQHHRHGEDDHH